jgi:hypothetical protein
MRQRIWEGRPPVDSVMRPLCFAFLALLAGCTSIQTQVEINAPAKDVRAVLYGFADYPKWNPFIVKVDGKVAHGSQVFVTVKPVGKAEISGNTVVTLMTDDHLAWTGSLAIPGLFSGSHDFIIEEIGPGKTVFHNNESMSGIIIPFYDFKPTEAGFEAMNQALKKRAEGP